MRKGSRQVSTKRLEFWCSAVRSGEIHSVCAGPMLIILCGAIITIPFADVKWILAVIHEMCCVGISLDGL